MAAPRLRFAIALGVCAVIALAAIVLAPRHHTAHANPLTGIAAVAGGDVHTCALTTGGNVLCWGLNYGLVPTIVPGLTGVAALESSGSHSCALTTSGGVKCWQQGSPPADVPGLTSNIVSIASGPDAANEFCAVTTAGAVRCRVVPSGFSDDPGLSSAVTNIGVGVTHGCAVMVGGSVKCWGLNESGQLGNGTSIDPVGPVSVIGLGEPVLTVDGGFNHTCAVVASGAVWCWGLGYGLFPVQVSGLAHVVAISTRYNHTCALTTAGSVKCWGSNGSGQLGDNLNCGVVCPAPVDVVGLQGGVSYINAGFAHTCAVMSAGDIKCWGINASGQLGDGTTTQRNVPVHVVTANVKPTATSTPCPLGGCPAATATPTAPPQTGIGFSISVDTDDDGHADCASGSGPAKCVISLGETFTLDVNLNSLPPAFTGYVGFDIYVTYSGLTSLNNASALSWPDCVYPAQAFLASSLRWGCVFGVGAPESFYVGAVGTNDFVCGTSGAITLVHGDGDTDIVSGEEPFQFFFEPQGTSETLTINCVAATATPAATPTRTPRPPSLGGVAGYPNASSGSGPGPWTALAAATALVALAGAGAARRFARR